MTFLIFVLGTVFGSFANVLIHRLPINQSIVFPASYCPHCKTKIVWYYNIPIISFFILGGRCKWCNNKISILYPVVEFVCGIIAVLLYLRFKNYLFTTIFFNLCFVLFVIGIIDYKTMEVPEVLSYYLIISGFLVSVINPTLGTNVFVRITNSLLGGIVGFGTVWGIEFFGNKIFKKPVIGFADIKIFCGIGTFLGYNSIFKILFLSSLVASGYILFLYFKTKKNVFGQYLPFVPFIFLGTFLYLIFFV